MTLTLLDIVGHTAWVLVALSYYVRDILVLRGLAVVSGLVSLVYNYFIPVGPLWLVIFWIVVIITINSVRTVGIIVEHRSIDFSEDELELHETVFQSFSPVEFMKLMRIGEWRTVESGHRFAEQGILIEGLKLLFNGEVVIERDGEEVGRVRDGSMIGEMSYIQGGAATATVTSTRPCRYVVRPKDKLRQLLKRNPSMDIAMKHVFSMDLTRKLAGPVLTMDG